jgi:hypothetical protein
MIPCVQTGKTTLDALSELSQSQLIATCKACGISTACDMGIATHKPENVQKFAKTNTIQNEEIDLRAIARQSHDFNDFHQRVEQAMKNNDSGFQKKEDTTTSLKALASSCQSFGEYYEKIKKRGDI